MTTRLDPLILIATKVPETVSGDGIVLTYLLVVGLYVAEGAKWIGSDA